MDYIEIIARVPAERREEAEAAAIMLSDGGIYTEDYSDLASEAPAVGGTEYIAQELLDRDRTVVRIHLYLSPSARGDQAAAILGARLNAAGIESSISVNGVSGADWENSWKQFYRPVEIGNRILVCPAWEQKSVPGRDVTVIIDPGMAFGSGLHATTRLAAARLEETVLAGDVVLDMGCGSGILGITALLLGAKAAAAADISDAAIEAAVKNAALNGVEDRLKIIRADQALKPPARYDLIAANIVADVIISYAADFFRALKRGGILIASGIISGREQETAAALAAAGFNYLRGSCEQEWHEMTFVKPEQTADAE